MLISPISYNNAIPLTTVFSQLFTFLLLNASMATASQTMELSMKPQKCHIPTNFNTSDLIRPETKIVSDQLCIQ